jgi:hypothetical protein
MQGFPTELKEYPIFGLCPINSENLKPFRQCGYCHSSQVAALKPFNPAIRFGGETSFSNAPTQPGSNVGPGMSALGKDSSP